MGGISSFPPSFLVKCSKLAKEKKVIITKYFEKSNLTHDLTFERQIIFKSFL